MNISYHTIHTTSPLYHAQLIIVYTQKLCTIYFFILFKEWMACLQILLVMSWEDWGGHFQPKLQNPAYNIVSSSNNNATTTAVAVMHQKYDQWQCIIDCAVEDVISLKKFFNCHPAFSTSQPSWGPYSSDTFAEEIWFSRSKMFNFSRALLLFGGEVVLSIVSNDLASIWSYCFLSITSNGS